MFNTVSIVDYDQIVYLATYRYTLRLLILRGRNVSRFIVYSL